MLAAFRRVYGTGSLDDVANTIGGLVKQNIDADTFKNGCALRLSYALQYGSNISVPQGGHQWKTSGGADSRRYIFKVRDMIDFLTKTFGPPEVRTDRPAASKAFAGKQGIIAFEVDQWSDASGHVTLWDGKHCADHCYFPISKGAMLWLLP
ncbi:MAG TPA: type VI secretion system amidase effector protein Tae4 [Polyangiales bacterium]